MWSGRCEAGRVGDRLPEGPEIEPAGDGLGDLEDEIAAGADDLAGDVDDLPPEPGGVAGERHGLLQAVRPP